MSSLIDTEQWNRISSLFTLQKKKDAFPFFFPDMTVTQIRNEKVRFNLREKKKAKIVSLGAQQLVTGAVHLKGHLYILFTPKRFIEL